jgi:aldehyde:ferredoxin oxidoreductase
MGRNEGFGKIVGEGTRKMAARYGRPPGEAMHCKGLEIPMHDPRAFSGQGLAYATCNRGADHNKSEAFMVENGMGNPDLGLVPGDRFGDDKAPMVVLSQNWQAFTDALGLCHFALISIENLTNMINYATGWSIDADAMLRAGERNYQIMRAVTCRFGVTPTDDILPEFALRPIPDGGQEGNVPNIAKMMPEYYSLRDWDSKTGLPSKERMESLGMGSLR